MRTIDIHEAKAQLSRLIEQAANGEAFVIAKDGKPMVKVVPLGTSTDTPDRLGFLEGQIAIPDDFDQIGSAEIEKLFNDAE